MRQIVSIFIKKMETKRIFWTNFDQLGGKFKVLTNSRMNIGEGGTPPQESSLSASKSFKTLKTWRKTWRNCWPYQASNKYLAGPIEPANDPLLLKILKSW